MTIAKNGHSNGIAPSLIDPVIQSNIRRMFANNKHNFWSKLNACLQNRMFTTILSEIFVLEREKKAIDNESLACIHSILIDNCDFKVCKMFVYKLNVDMLIKIIILQKLFPNLTTVICHEQMLKDYRFY